jgi:hypothetical protein
MDHDDLLVIRVPSTVLNPTLDRRPRASEDAKIRVRPSTGTAAVRKQRTFRESWANRPNRPEADLLGPPFERARRARKRTLAEGVSFS